MLALDFIKKIIKKQKFIKNFAPKNYKFSKNKKNISIINKNALDYKVTDENVFFFFDPFSEKILNIFLKKIISIKKRKRVIYNLLHQKKFNIKK